MAVSVSVQQQEGRGHLIKHCVMVSISCSITMLKIMWFTYIIMYEILFIFLVINVYELLINY